MHRDPLKRPSAKQLTIELNKLRTGLQEAVKSRRKANVSELKKESSAEARKQRIWFITDTADPEIEARWSHGRYSLHELRSAEQLVLNGRKDEREYRWNPETRAKELKKAEGGAPFHITVNTQMESDWEEMALKDDELKPTTSDEASGGLPTQPLGIEFGPWPKVSKVVKKVNGMATLAPMYPEIKAGCILKKINGEDAPTEVTVTAVFSDSGTLGVVFGDRWPVVKDITPGTMGAQVLGLQVDCMLLSINGVPIVDNSGAALMPFKEAVPLVKERPCTMLFRASNPMLAIPALQTPRQTRLTMEFASPASESVVPAWSTGRWAGSSAVPPWIQAGLDAVGLVRSYEEGRDASGLARKARLASKLRQLQALQAEVNRLQEPKPKPELESAFTEGEPPTDTGKPR